MAGYSGTPLPKKLGIKPNHRLALVAAPKGFARTLGSLPDGVHLCTSGTFDVAVAFYERARDLERDLAKLKARMDPAAGLWIAWPKKASGVESDITEDVVRRFALAVKLVDNKVCAIDDIWSGLRIVVRVSDRPASAKKNTAKKTKKR
jgi:hypothetical protein